MGWGLSWLGGLGGRSGKAQLQWGEGRGRLAAALARAPARDALARICLAITSYQHCAKTAATCSASSGKPPECW